jgi:hypothetical protein
LATVPTVKRQDSPLIEVCCNRFFRERGEEG